MIKKRPAVLWRKSNYSLDCGSICARIIDTWKFRTRLTLMKAIRKDWLLSWERVVATPQEIFSLLHALLDLDLLLFTTSLLPEFSCLYLIEDRKKGWPGCFLADDRALWSSVRFVVASCFRKTKSNAAERELRFLSVRHIPAALSTLFLNHRPNISADPLSLPAHFDDTSMSLHCPFCFL